MEVPSLWLAGGAIAVAVLAGVRAGQHARSATRPSMNTGAVPRALGVITAAFVVVATLALFAAPMPGCIRLFQWNDPASAILTTAVVAVGVGAIWWVWGPGGAALAEPSRFEQRGPMRFPEGVDPLVIRLVVTHVVVLGLLVALLVAGNSVPSVGCVGAG